MTLSSVRARCPGRCTSSRAALCRYSSCYCILPPATATTIQLSPCPDQLLCWFLKVPSLITFSEHYNAGQVEMNERAVTVLKKDSYFRNLELLHTLERALYRISC